MELSTFTPKKDANGDLLIESILVKGKIYLIMKREVIPAKKGKNGFKSYTNYTVIASLIGVDDKVNIVYSGINNFTDEDVDSDNCDVATPVKNEKAALLAELAPFIKADRLEITKYKSVHLDLYADSMTKEVERQIECAIADLSSLKADIDLMISGLVAKKIYRVSEGLNSITIHALNQRLKDLSVKDDVAKHLQDLKNEDRFPLGLL